MPVTLHRMQRVVKGAALCAASDLDSLDGMSDASGAPKKPRGHAIPRVDWWCELATERVKEHSHVELAQMLATEYDYEVSSTSVGRVLNGDNLTLETALLLCDRFDLPPPVIIPTSEDEAWKLVGKQQRITIRAQLSVLRAGVAKRIDSRQAASIRSQGERKHQPRPKR
jgi:hypothetical protein